MNESNSKYKNLDPKIAKFLEQLAKQDGPPIYTLPAEKARKVLEDLQAPSVNKLPVQIQDEIIPVGPDGKLSIRIIRPVNAQGKLPVVMYFHGAGWILGSENTHDQLVRTIANEANVAIVFVNYSRSPEAHYPKPIEEAYAATKYIAENGAKFNLDTKHLIIAGDSVGGNMAIAVTMLAKERGGPKINYQILFYPVTDANFNNASYQEFGDGSFWLSKKSMEWFWNAYAPDMAQRNNPTACPLKATIEQLRGLPDALIFTNENDVLRDEGESYAHKLMQAGVQVTAIRYLGAIHDLVLLAPIQDTAAAKNSLKVACEKIKEVFAK